MLADHDARAVQGHAAAKVPQLADAPGRDEDVARLDVHVDDPPGVAVPEGLHQLAGSLQQPVSVEGQKKWLTRSIQRAV